MVDILLRRYLWLVKTLRDRGEMTYEDISSAWERSSENDDGSVLSKRTLYNHCQAVLKHFGVVITCRRGRNLNLYYIENPDIFDNNDINGWLIDSFTVGSILADSQSVSDRILLESVPSGQLHLADIVYAIKNSVRIEITYRSFNNDKEHRFIIEPYCAKLFRQRWYILGRNLKHDEIRIYALDRIKNIVINKETFKIPASFDGKTYFDDCFGIISDRAIRPEKIRLKVSAHQRNYFNSLPLHHSQRETERNDIYSIYEYFVRPTFDFQKELLSYGAEIEVLEPEWFRDKITEVVNDMLKVYNAQKKTTSTG